MRVRVIAALVAAVLSASPAAARQVSPAPDAAASPVMMETAPQHARYASFARKIVRDVLHAKQGHVVVLAGAPNYLELMEDTAIELRKIGAFSVIAYGSNRINRMYYADVPARWDSQTPRDLLRLASIADAIVFFDYPNDPKLYASFPPARVAAVNKAGAAAFASTLSRNIPFIDVGNGLTPSPVLAEMTGVTEEQLSDLFWNGLNVDFARLGRDARAMQTALQAARSIHVTARNGTNITFSATGSTMFRNDGTIGPDDRARGGAALQKYLPAGDVFFIPAPGSARGTVTFGTEYFGGKKVSGMTMRFSGGRMTSMHAGEGEDQVRKLYAAGGPDRDEFTFADFGVNRAVSYPAGSAVFAGMAAGMVTLGIGGDNTIGGKNTSPFGFAGYIPNATVTVDGRKVIANGKLLAGS